MKAKLQLLLLFALIVFQSRVAAQSNPTAQALPYNDNFKTYFDGTKTAYPAGWQGWTISGSTSSTQTNGTITFPTAAPNGDQALAAGGDASKNGGGLYDGNKKLNLVTTSSAQKAAALSINTTNLSNIFIKAHVGTMRNDATGSRISKFGLQYRVGTSGPFTSLKSDTNTFTNVARDGYRYNNLTPSGNNKVSANDTSIQNLVTLVYHLPSDANLSSVVQLRWVYQDSAGSGNRPSFTIKHMQVFAKPDLSSGGVSPTSCALNSNDVPITVTGTNFISGDSKVFFGNNQLQTTFVNSTSLVATIPANYLFTAGPVTVSVKNVTSGLPAYTDPISTATFTVGDGPTISALVTSPTTVTAGGTGNVTITIAGTNFIAGTVVNFNGTALTTNVVSTTQLTATLLPAQYTAGQNASITVSNTNGTSGSTTLAINNPLPTASSLSPISLKRGSSATTLTVTGTNFNSTSVIYFNGTAKTTTFISTTQLSCQLTTANLATSGSYTVNVNNPSPGGGTSGNVSFLVYDQAEITTTATTESFTGFLGTSPGPTAWTITATGTQTSFQGSTSNTTGGWYGNNNLVYNGSSTATGGTAVWLLHNNTGVAIPGFSLSYKGQLFSNLNGFAQTQTVSYATSSTTTAGSFTAFTGNGASITGSDINLTTATQFFPDAVTASIPANGYLFVKFNWSGGASGGAYAIDDITVTPNVAAGLTLTLNGSSVANGGTASFGSDQEGNNTALTFTVTNSASSIANLQLTGAVAGSSDYSVTTAPAATVAAGASTTFTLQLTRNTIGSPAGTYTLTNNAANSSPYVINLSGTTTAAVGNPVPSVASISPATINQLSADFTLTVNGTFFRSGATVLWGGTALATTFVSATQLTALVTTTQTASSGNVTVTVNNAPLAGQGGGTSLSSANFYLVPVINPVPTVTSLSPNNVNVGSTGFTLTVNGTGFAPNSPVVQFNGTDLTTTYVSPTQLTATVPTNLLTTFGYYPVTVFNPTPGGGTSGSVNFAVNSLSPTFTSVSPNSTYANGSNLTVTVAGTNFVTGTTVNWNGSARATTVNSATSLTATILAADIATAGAGTITVTNPLPGGGTTVSGTNFTILANATPANIVATAVTAETFTGFAGTAANNVPPTNWLVAGTGSRGTTWNGSSTANTATTNGWYGGNLLGYNMGASANNGTATWTLKNNSGSDISKFKLSYTGFVFRNNAAGVSTATVSYAISSTLSVPAASAFVPFSSGGTFTNGTVTEGTTGSAFTTNQVSSTLANGSFIYIRVSFSTPDNNGSYLGIDDVNFLPSPSVDVTGSPVSVGGLERGSVDNQLYQLNLTPTFAPATVTALSVSATGTVTASDFTGGYSLVYSADSNLDATDVTLKTISGGTGTLSFTGFSQVFPVATTGYLFIKATVAANATLGRTLNIGNTDFSNLTLSDGTKTGTSPANTASSFTITLPTGYYASKATGNWSSVSNWLFSTDSINYVNASFAPSSDAKSVTIKPGHTVTLTANTTVTKNLFVESGATLKTKTFVLSGAGNFTLRAGSFVETQNAGGFTATGSTGAVQVTGTRNYGTGANFIFDGTTAQTTGLGNLTAASLTASNAAGLTLSNSISIIDSLKLLAGAFNANSKVVTLLSSAAKTASIPALGSTASLTNASNFTVQRWFDPANAVVTGAWFSIGTPVSGQKINAWDVTNNNYVSNTYVPYPATRTSVLLYNPSNATAAAQNGWLKPTAATDAFGIGKGALVWMTAAFLRQPSTVISLKGTPATGQFTFPLTYCASGCAPTVVGGASASNGWNLIANPYAATINWDADQVTPSAWTKTNVASAIYVYRHNIKAYAAYVAGSGVNGGSPLIPSGQAFFVNATSASPVLKINEAAKSYRQTGILRTTATGKLMLELSDGTHSDEALVISDDNASRTFESDKDAAKMTGSILNISTQPVNGTWFAINRMAFSSTEVLPVNVNAAANGAYSIKFKAFNMDATQAWLKDAFTGLLTPIVEGDSYNFNITTDPATQGDGRFSIIFSRSIAAVAAKNSLKAILFPNPARNQVNISLPSVTTGAKATVHVINAIGTVVSVNELSGNEGSLNVSGLSAGVYMVKISTSEGVATERLVIE